MGKANYYTPVVDQRAATQAEIRRFLEGVMGSRSEVLELHGAFGWARGLRSRPGEHKTGYLEPEERSVGAQVLVPIV